MNNFENPSSSAEVPKTPEQLKSKLSELYTRQAQLQELIKTSGENIDAELGSEEYIDHGHTAELREEIEPEIKEIETRLAEIDDASAAQRNLNI